MQPSACKSCGAAIYWAVTPSGARMPVDVAPRADGNLVLLRDAAGTGLTTGQATDKTPPHSRFASHFATCKNADQHRKAKP